MAAILKKAKFQKVEANKKHTPINAPIEVVFNPESVKTNMSLWGAGQDNNVIYYVELIFDSVDKLNPNNPISVQTVIDTFEEYISPAKKNEDTPPLYQFQWGDLIFTGIVEILNINFDSYCSNGTPLTAKCNLMIKAQ